MYVHACWKILFANHCITSRHTCTLLISSLPFLPFLLRECMCILTKSHLQTSLDELWAFTDKAIYIILIYLFCRPIRENVPLVWLLAQIDVATCCSNEILLSMFSICVNCGTFSVRTAVPLSSAGMLG